MRTLINKSLLACIFLVLPLTVFAASGVSSQSRGPVEITADRLEVDDKTQVLIFEGNAVASQDDITIHGDRLTVRYAGEEREIVQVVAEGKVRILQGTRTATGERAVLYHSEERIVLTGSPQVRDGDNFVQGQEVSIYLNDQRSVVSGGAGGRVNAVFTPQSEGKP